MKAEGSKESDVIPLDMPSRSPSSAITLNLDFSLREKLEKELARQRFLDKSSQETPHYRDFLKNLNIVPNSKR